MRASGRTAMLAVVTAMGLAAAPGVGVLAPARESRAGGTQAAPAVAAQKVFRSVTPAQARQLLESRRDLLLVDVRSPEEFRDGSLPGALPIPFRSFLKGQFQLPKEQPLLLVCAVGGRSLAVGQYLSLQGYREVYNLEGGLENWARQGVPLPHR